MKFNLPRQIIASVIFKVILRETALQNEVITPASKKQLNGIEKIASKIKKYTLPKEPRPITLTISKSSNLTSFDV